MWKCFKKCGHLINQLYVEMKTETASSYERERYFSNMIEPPAEYFVNIVIIPRAQALV